MTTNAKADMTNQRQRESKRDVKVFLDAIWTLDTFLKGAEQISGQLYEILPEDLRSKHITRMCQPSSRVLMRLRRARDR
jgi:hypothetical protein